MSREMKETGISYLGLIPDKWQKRRVKTLSTCLDGKRIPVDATLRVAGPYPYWGAGSIVDYVNDYIFDDTLVLVGEDGAPFFDDTRSVSILSKGKIWVNNHIHVLKNNEAVMAEYLAYALRVVDYSDYLTGSVFPKLTQGNMNEIYLAIPPILEQQAIVRYLDSKCSAIDEAIERHKKIIEKLEEYRGAEIARLVSFQGANDTYETNNIWFPTLPKNVSISRIGMHFDVTLGKMLCPKQRDKNDTLERYYCAGDIHFDNINQNGLKEMWFSPNEKKLYEVTNGDLLIVEGGAGAGNAFIVSEQSRTTYIQNSVLRIRASQTGSVRYLKYLIEHLVKHGYIAYACNTATFSHFTKDKVSLTPFPVTSFDVQEAIADRIDTVDGTVRKAQEKHELIIEKLEEYRKSIIYNAVTGKIDCMEVTKNA